MRQHDAPLVEALGVSLAYRAQPAVIEVDLRVREGSTLVLLGPNGAGKTSLMRLIAGRLAPSRGSVRVGGGDPYGDRAVRRRIGWVPQDIALYPRLTVAENLDVFARLSGLPRRDRREAVAAILDRTRISDVAHRRVEILSGGYQRRVNIAASLLADPRLILLDEPTQGVDLDARAAIHALLASLKAAGAAILLSTHDFAEAERLADRVAIVHAGRILREAALAELLDPLSEAPAEQEAVLDEPAGPEAAAALRRAGFLPLADAGRWRSAHGGDGPDGAALMSALRGQGVRIAELRLRRPGLETVYRDALALAAAAAPA